MHIHSICHVYTRYVWYIVLKTNYAFLLVYMSGFNIILSSTRVMSLVCSIELYTSLGPGSRWRYASYTCYTSMNPKFILVTVCLRLARAAAAIMPGPWQLHTRFLILGKDSRLGWPWQFPGPKDSEWLGTWLDDPGGQQVPAPSESRCLRGRVRGRVPKVWEIS